MYLTKKLKSINKLKLLSVSALAMMSISLGIANNNEIKTQEPKIVRAVNIDADGNPLPTNNNSNNSSNTTTNNNSTSAKDNASASDAKSNVSSNDAKDEGNPSYNSNSGFYNLSADPTFGDLYASIIFTKGNESTVSKVDLSYNEIRKYGDNSSTNNQIYGNLIPSDSSTSLGNQLANYLYTLNKYQWISTVRNDSEDFVLVRAINWFGSKVKGKVAEFMLNTASFGASMYGVGVGLINAFGDALGKADVPALFGFRTSSGTNSNLINKFLLGIFQHLGFSDANGNATGIKIVQNLLWLILSASAIIGIIGSLGRLRLNESIKKFGRLALRVWVIGMTMYGTGFLQEIINNFTSTVTQEYKAVSDADNRYVVDTLKWAVYGNLDPTMISSSSLSGSDADAVAAGFKPSIQTIQSLNQKINIKSGLNSNLPNGFIDENAGEYLQKLADGSQSNVNDYFAAIKNSDSPAALSGPSTSTTITAGKYYDSKHYSNNLPNFVYFMSQNGKKKEDAKYDTLKKMFENSSDDADAAAKANWYTFGPSEMQIVVPYIQTQNAYKYRRVKLQNADTYIYGASTSNSEASGDYNNFINGAGTIQNNNPISGDESEYYGDKMKVAMYTNSLAIAIYNRYGGTGSGNSLSTQSTSFLLQTALKADGLEFQGYNTSVSTTDKGKATSSNGATFVRYVMPAYNSADRLVRIGAINMNWLLAGVSALIAFWYLLKAPIVSALVKMITSFFRALTSGNLISLLQYLAYYAAIQFSFAFAMISVYVGVEVGSLVTDQVPILGQLFNISGDGFATGTIKAATGISIPSMGAIFVSLLMGFLLSWPMVTLRLGANKKNMKVGIIGIVVLIPYLIAESIDDYLDVFERILYGRSHRNSFLHKLGNKTQLVDQSDRMKKIGQTGLNLAAAAVTGGASAAAMAAGKMALGSAINSAANGADGEAGEGTMDNYGDVDQRTNSISSMLSNAGKGIRDLGTGLGATLENKQDLVHLDDAEEDAYLESQSYIPKTHNETAPNDKVVPIVENEEVEQAELDKLNVNTLEKAQDDTIKLASQNDIVETVKLEDTSIKAQLDDNKVEANLDDKKFGSEDATTDSKTDNLLKSIHDEMVDVESAITNQEIKPVIENASEVKLDSNGKEIKVDNKGQEINLDNTDKKVSVDVNNIDKADNKVQTIESKFTQGTKTPFDTKQKLEIQPDGYIKDVVPTTDIEKRLHSIMMKNPEYKAADNDFKGKVSNYNSVKSRYDEAVNSKGSDSREAKALGRAAELALKEAQIASAKRDTAKTNFIETREASRNKRDAVINIAQKGTDAMSNASVKNIVEKSKETIVKAPKAATERVIEKSKETVNNINNVKDSMVSKGTDKFSQFGDKAKASMDKVKTQPASQTMADVTKAATTAATTAAKTAVKSVDKAAYQAGKTVIKPIVSAPVKAMQNPMVNKAVTGLAMGTINNLAGTGNGLKNPFDAKNNPYLKSKDGEFNNGNMSSTHNDNNQSMTSEQADKLIEKLEDIRKENIRLNDNIESSTENALFNRDY